MAHFVYTVILIKSQLSLLCREGDWGEQRIEASWSAMPNISRVDFYFELEH